MFGIAGIIGAKSNKERLDAMLSAQTHRGPDDTGKYIDSGIVLGHNRLSIIDLSSDANQPFVSQDGRYILVYNGDQESSFHIWQWLNTSLPLKNLETTEP